MEKFVKSVGIILITNLVATNVGVLFSNIMLSLSNKLQLGFIKAISQIKTKKTTVHRADGEEINVG